MAQVGYVVVSPVPRRPRPSGLATPIRKHSGPIRALSCDAPAPPLHLTAGDSWFLNHPALPTGFLPVVVGNPVLLLGSWSRGPPACVSSVGSPCGPALYLSPLPPLLSHELGIIWPVAILPLVPACVRFTRFLAGWVSFQRPTGCVTHILKICAVTLS